MEVTVSLVGITLLEFAVIVFLFKKISCQDCSIKQLEVQEERYRVASEITNDILFEYDIKKDRMAFAAKYKENFGGIEDFPDFAAKLEMMELVHEEDQGVFYEFALDLKKGQPVLEAEFRMQNVKGDYVWCRFRGKSICMDGDVAVKVIGKLINIDIQKKELEILQIKSQLDPLTNVFNKAVSKEKIEEKLLHSTQEESHALMIIDIDNFKRINDNYGHILGDRVLVNIMSHVRHMFREEDIVGRIGGDEFIVFMSHVNTQADIAKKAARLCTAFQNRYRAEDIEIEVTGSIGIAVFPQDGSDYETLLEKADKALYEVKAEGKNSYNFYLQNI